MALITPRQRRWFFANKPRINVQRKISSRVKIYGGFNTRIGPYGGLVVSNSKGGSINPRANLRYGPSIKAQQRINKNISIQGTAAPHKLGVNVKAKYKGNYASAGYQSTSGPYVGVGNKKIGMDYSIKKKKFNLNL